MEMWTIGFLVGVLAAILIAVLAYVVSNNRHKIKDTYDERQVKARGEGYKIGFLVAMLGLFLLLFLEFYSTDEKLNINLIFPIVIVAFVSLTVFACVCIWKDAWLNLYEKPKKTIISLSLVCVSNYVLGFLNYYNYCYLLEQDIKILDETALKNMINGLPYDSTAYELSAFRAYMPWINIICATVILILIINYLIKLAVDKSREKRETNEES